MHRSVAVLFRRNATTLTAANRSHADTKVLARCFSNLSLEATAAKKQQDVFYSRITRKLNNLSAPLSMEAINRTITFLQSVGINRSRALASVARHPMIAWLQENGITGSMLATTILRHPNILGVREQAMEDIKEWYIQQGVPQEKVPFLISVFPQAVSTSITENLDPKIEFLQEKGLSRPKIVRILNRTPQIMSLSIERMQANVSFFKERGLNDQDLLKLLVLVPESLSLSPKNIDSKLALIAELYGEENEVVKTWMTNPRVIMRNGSQLRHSHTYLTTVCGIPNERLKKNIGLIMRSVKGILQPRFEFLKTTRDPATLEQILEKSAWILDSNNIFTEKYPKYPTYLSAQKS